jgi:hypothetical protein
MRTRRGVLMAMLASALALPSTLRAQDFTPWFGTWKLNLEQSTYNSGSAPYRRSTFTMKPTADGGVEVIYDMVGVRGGLTHLEWTGKIDGRDYDVQGVEEYITYAYSRVDDRTLQIILKVDGNPVASSRVVLSTDGRSLTTTTSGTGAQGQKVTSVTVYYKQ